MWLCEVSPRLYKAAGVDRRLITATGAVRGVRMLVLGKGAVDANFGYGGSLVNSFGAGVGFLVAMVMFAGVRERLESCEIPKFLEGLPITLVAASLVSLSFLGFTGLVENMFA